MSYKPDNYHQTDPPCELKKDVMGRQGSKKGQKESTPSDEGSDASPCSAGKLYAKRDLKGIASLYGKHLMAMTSEGLHSKSDIAAELAWRDFQIQELEKQNVKNNRPHNLT